MGKNLILLILYLSVPPLAGYTQSQNSGNINAITTAVPFLLITPDARTRGLGEAGAASSPDGNSIYSNASKLAFIDQKFGFSLSYLPWLRSLVPDINIGYFSGYYKLKEGQAIGGSVLYNSLGGFNFRDSVGNITYFRPKEYAFDFSFTRRLSDNFSMAVAGRYIYSDLTGGIAVGGIPTFPGQSVAADVSAYYQNDKITINEMKSTLAFGINVSNIGPKIKYSNSGRKDVIPTNLRLGTSYKIIPNDFYSLALLADVNKLLVPTPPVYGTSSSGNSVIIAGKDPNRNVWNGILQSFNDAPGGREEELKEIIYSTGLELWLKEKVAIRTGYFHEAETKGNQKYFSFGTGVKYKAWAFDIATLFPTTGRHPLSRTVHFTLSVNY